MLLHSGVSAKSISRVHFKLNEITIKMLSVLAEIGWLRIAIPFNPGASRIKELVVEPFHDDFLVVGGIRAIERRVRRRRLLPLTEQIADQKQYRGAKRKPFHPVQFFIGRTELVEPNSWKNWKNHPVNRRENPDFLGSYWRLLACFAGKKSYDF